MFLFVVLGLYLTSASGMIVNLHFCGKKLALIQVNAEKIKSCCSTSKGAEDNCCKNQQFSIKIKDNYASVSASKIPAVKSFDLFETFRFRAENLLLTTKEFNPSVVTNPPPLGTDLRIKNCVFRI